MASACYGLPPTEPDFVFEEPVTVSELTSYVRDLLESDEVLADLWVEGEVLESFTSRAGHIYFSLADDDSRLRCVLFRAAAIRQRTRPVIGEQCAVHGRVSVYEREGSYQLYVDLIQPAGIGMRALEFELLRQRLEAEGLFDSSRKRPLPPRPRVIGVVTSEEGAVWHDIQSVIRRRNPFVELLLAPTMVQGALAPAGIIGAIESLQIDGRADVIIVARGGGSPDDLAWFNDERLLRCAFACPIPVVSAVGHESDWTLFDYVADLRAPTPSAAAELCSPNVAERLAYAWESVASLRRRAIDCHAQRQRAHAAASRRLTRSRAVQEVGHRRRNLESTMISLAVTGSEQTRERHDRTRTMSRLMVDKVGRQIERQRSRLCLDRGILAPLEPTRTLARGYQVVTDTLSGVPIATASELVDGQAIETTFHDGTVESVVRRRAPQEHR